MSFEWKDLVDGEDFVTAEPINRIANEVIELGQNIGDIDAAFDELHAYAQALINGGDAV